jgi:hypothetical protein
VTSFIRLILTGFLLYHVAIGHTWALITILILMTCAHEAAALTIGRIMKTVTALSAAINAYLDRVKND